MVFDYEDLKLRIKKYFKKQELFAKAMGMSYTALNQRLNGIIQWKIPEIYKACKLLDIPLNEVHLYFFVQKVEKISTFEEVL